MWTIAARLRQSYPKQADVDGVRVNPLSLVPGDGHRVVAAFMQLARAAGRQREIALRISLGASRALTLTFALAVTLVTALAVGALPALRGTKLDLVPALKIGAGATAQRHRLRRALLVAQIAVSMLLVVTAWLFGRSLVPWCAGISSL